VASTQTRDLAAGPEALAGPEPPRRRRRGKAPKPERTGVWYPRWYWPSFAVPGTLWLLLFFLVPFYVILSVAFGTVDPIFRSPLPVWQPWYWSSQYLTKVLSDAVGFQAPVYVRTLVYVVTASAICIVISYVVAYYVARFSGRRKGFYLVLLVAPFFISYLMRMLAWINLLEPDGYVNRIMNLLPFVPHDVNWLAGNPVTLVLGLVYGYVPYMILPFYAFLDRIDQNLLEAGRDLGASPARTFFRVTLPLSKQAILAGIVIVTLPMFGDYYTHDLLSPSPRTSMVGNILDGAVQTTGEGPQAAVIVILLMIILLIPMIYYLRSTNRAMEAG
jgi:ABC-type spermidine/putrescine transport system permease subunit I